MVKVLIAVILYVLTPFLFFWGRKKWGKQQRLFKGSVWLDVLFLIAGLCIVCEELPSLIKGMIRWDQFLYEALMWIYGGYSLLLFDYICTTKK